MQGTVSFHPVDGAFFADLIQPLMAGRKVDPGAFLEAARRQRLAAFHAGRYLRQLAWLRQQSTPPPPPAGATVWEKTRAWMERFDFRPDPISLIATTKVEVDLHLRGRPFLIAAATTEGVVQAVDGYCQAGDGAAAERMVAAQLRLLHPELERGLQADGDGSPGAELAYRNELLSGLKDLHDLAASARQGGDGADASGTRRPAAGVLADDLPWRALYLHSRAVPYWVADNVDGLDTVCRMAAIAAPEALVPAWSLFASACEEYPGLQEGLGTELQRPGQVGGYVAPAEIPLLLEFLKAQGGAIIRAASRHGEGRACETLLRKIRECACYAREHGHGYLEAAGIEPLAADLWADVDEMPPVH